MKKFCADFETTTDPKDCRVWAYAICEIGDVDNFIYGNSIDDFMQFCMNPKENYKIYFHNLKFDSSFILAWLEDNGFEYVEDKKNNDSWTYTTLITDMGTFYSVEIYFTKHGKRINKVTFYDSLKILNFSVEEIAKGFNLPIRKLNLDYKAKREIGHELTNEEIDYIRNDVEIVARALEIMFEDGHEKMTIGSNAMANYKEFNDKFMRYFPVLSNEIDSEIRKSYKGGFTYLNPKYKEKTTGNGLVLDVNSEYPSIMRYKKLPYGSPQFFTGEYVDDPVYDLYIITFSCSFKLKKNKIPSIQIKHTMDFMNNEYLESSKDLIVTLTLTSVDYELFRQNYDVEDLTFQGGLKFKSKTGLFNEYIDYWTERKIQSKKDGNKAMYLISKLFLNSLYGRFGISTKSILHKPILKDDGVVHYECFEGKPRKSVYTAMASFITSYGRRYIIESSQTIRDWSLKKYGDDYWIYNDTDSIHFRTDNEDEDVAELSKIMEIDDYKLGAWKPESRFKRGSYIRQKCYIEEDYDGNLNVTIAGFPKYLAPLMKFEDFKIGFTTKGLTIEDLKNKAIANGATPDQIERIHHKLRYHHVKGGVILEDTDFTLKGN